MCLLVFYSNLLKNSLWSPWTGDQNKGPFFKSLILQIRRKTHFLLAPLNLFSELILLISSGYEMLVSCLVRSFVHFWPFLPLSTFCLLGLA